MSDKNGQGRTATLAWGVKQSFCAYVKAMGGEIGASAGAVQEEGGEFVFEQAPDSAVDLGADGAPQGQVRFVGEVTFNAHGGMLKVFLADPILDFTASPPVLTLADSPARDRRDPVARLDLPAMTLEGDELVIPTALTWQGGQLLGDHYPANTPIDPVRVRFTAARGG